MPTSLRVRAHLNVAQPSRLQVSAASRRQTFVYLNDAPGTVTVPELAGEDACATFRARGQGSRKK